MTINIKESDPIWFTSDTHFYHRGALQFRQNFRSVEHMTATMIHKWNDIVSPGDTVYHLGDFVMNANTTQQLELIAELNGSIILIEGNHDRGMKRKVRDAFYRVTPYEEIDVIESDGFKQRIVMSHYPFKTWNRAHYGSWQLHGHSHGNLKPHMQRQLDVGVDPNGFMPIGYSIVREYMNRWGACYETYDHHKEGYY